MHALERRPPATLGDLHAVGADVGQQAGARCQRHGDVHGGGALLGVVAAAEAAEAGADAPPRVDPRRRRAPAQRPGAVQQRAVGGIVRVLGHGARVRLGLDAVEHRREVGRRHPLGAVLGGPLVQHVAAGAQHDHPVDQRAAAHRAPLQHGHGDVVGGARPGLGVEALRHRRLLLGEVSPRHQPPSSRMTTSSPASASRAAATAPPAPVPTTHTSARTRVSGPRRAPSVIPRIHPSLDSVRNGGEMRMMRGSARAIGSSSAVTPGAGPSHGTRGSAVVQRAAVADRGVGGRVGIEGGEHQPAQCLEDRAPQGDAAGLPSAQPRVLPRGLHLPEADGDGRGKRGGGRVVEQGEDPCDLHRLFGVHGGQPRIHRAGQGGRARVAVGQRHHAAAERFEGGELRSGERHPARRCVCEGGVRRAPRPRSIGAPPRARQRT